MKIKKRWHLSIHNTKWHTIQDINCMYLYDGILKARTECGKRLQFYCNSMIYDLNPPLDKDKCKVCLSL
jgi:hypothetical protein